MLILSSCTTIEVAKEVTKASQSIKTSVSNMINSNHQNNDEKISVPEPDNIVKEIEMVEENKKDEREKIIEQKKIARIVFIGKTYEEIEALLGTPQLKRTDGNIQILRFDRNNCRLFLFFNTKTNPVNVKYFELRDNYGDLIDLKKKIQECYEDLDLN